MQFISNPRLWLRWLPAIFFAMAIFIFSSIPGSKVDDSLDKLTTTVKTISPAVSQTPHTPVFFSKIEWLKVGHGIGYFCLGIAMLYALTTRSRWSALTALVICSLYAGTDELHQTFTPGRSASIRDVLLDSLAALAGILILLGIVKWRTHRKSRQVP